MNRLRRLLHRHHPEYEYDALQYVPGGEPVRRRLQECVCHATRWVGSRKWARR